MLSKVLGAQSWDIIGSWRKQYNEELHDLYFSTNVIRVKEDSVGEACSMYWGEGKSLQGFGG